AAIELDRIRQPRRERMVSSDGIVCPQSEARCRPQVLAATLIVVLGLVGPRSAHAIPAFARKYGTSCQTCHPVYPKLTPFGEAFRRNGYRFPGIAIDVVKREMV